MTISEFMADNTAGLKDDLGNRSDWIELCNTGDEAVDLAGWFLTDDPGRLFKWRLPAWILKPKGYLLVWASEADRTNPSAPLHTNFKLAAAGEYLALADPRTNLVSEFAPSYPPQQPNISFGRDQVQPELTGYFSVPTPGAANSTAGSGFAPVPTFSVPGGVYTNASLGVSLSAADGEIRYTLDGSVPLQTSPRYTGPVTINVGTIIQARVFQQGRLPSAIVAETYTFLDTTAVSFSSNLPLLVVQTSGRGIPQDSRTRAFISTFEPVGGRTRLSDSPALESAVEIEERGQTSAGFPKTPYNLEIQDLYGNDRAVPLLGLPAESDWVLHNPYTDKCLMNNVLAFELDRQMGHAAPRCRFVEVFVKTSRGRLSYPADYRGVYVLMEKIKIDPNRVDLQPLTPADSHEPEITGGYIIKKDKDSPDDLDFWTDGGGSFGGQHLKYHDPKPREITPAQQEWIASYIRQLERSLYATDWLRRTGTNHYSHYLDLDSLVDYHWMVEFTKQIDGYRLSNYMSKDRGGKLKMEPIWDWNLAWGNADYLDGWNTNGWYYPLISDSDHIWLRRLIAGTPNGYDRRGDPDFNQKIIDRWAELRTNILAPGNILRRVDQIAAELNEAQARDFAKYPRLDTYVWPNPSFYIAPTYSAIISAMKRWIEGRFGWIDRQFLKSPAFSAPGGKVPAGFRVALSAAAGTILFTTNGTDPRLPQGAVHPEARNYDGQPITIEANARLFARARSGTNWSGPAVATYVTQTPPLVVTEIMYHPAPPSPGSTNTAEDFEFIELKNVGPADLSLPGFRFTRGIDFIFGQDGITNLVAGAHVLLVRNAAAFASRYPERSGQVAGQYVGSLENGGERLTMEGPLREPILDFRYDSQWFPITDGHGFSLVPRDELAPPDSWGDPAKWRPSRASLGSPGIDDPPGLEIPPVFVNEALSRPGPSQSDAVELYNPGSVAANIGGWFVTDDLDLPQKFRIPAGTIIAAGGLLILDRAHLEATGSAAFALSANGDDIYLFSGDGASLTGYMHGYSFGPAAAGISFGRYVTSSGQDHFVTQLRTTLGEPNAGPKVGPIVMTEIMFQPATLAGVADAEGEYIELLNTAQSTVSLGGSVGMTNSWQVSGGVTFPFPPQATLQPQQIGLLVGFSPTNRVALARFRDRYQVPATVPIFGPWQGNLDNSGERVALTQPDPTPTADGGNDRPANLLVEQIHYDPHAPWPTNAAGTGFSIQRMTAAEDGDDPSNWAAAAPTPGLDNTSTDADGDGLPDLWEQRYFGNLTSGAGDDPDDDGLSNAQEYGVSTDPSDSSSYLHLEYGWSGAGDLQLSFRMAPWRTYTIQVADQIGGGWRDLQVLPAAGQGRITVTLNGPGAFYRLAVSRL